MNQISFDELFAEDKKITTPPLPLSPLQQDIIDEIQAGETSAMAICEELIRAGKLSNERYSTNKPKAYGKVCTILEDLVAEGTLRFVEDRDKKDRIYLTNKQ